MHSLVRRPCSGTPASPSGDRLGCRVEGEACRQAYEVFFGAAKLSSKRPSDAIRSRILAPGGGVPYIIFIWLHAAGKKHRTSPVWSTHELRIGSVYSKALNAESKIWNRGL